jgi:hypothetical protein
MWFPTEKELTSITYYGSLSGYMMIVYYKVSKELFFVSAVYNASVRKLSKYSLNLIIGFEGLHRTPHRL